MARIILKPLENANLRDPNRIARGRLRLGGKYEHTAQSLETASLKCRRRLSNIIPIIREPYPYFLRGYEYYSSESDDSEEQEPDVEGKVIIYTRLVYQ